MIEEMEDISEARDDIQRSFDWEIQRFTEEAKAESSSLWRDLKWLQDFCKHCIKQIRTEWVPLLCAPVNFKNLALRCSNYSSELI